MIADVIAVGARGPLGLSSLQVAMGVRAGKLEPRSLRQRDKRDHEIGMALTGGLGETLVGFHRLVGLAAPALCEALDGLSTERAPTEQQPLSVVLCLCEPGRPDDQPAFGEQLLAAIAERSGIAIDLERSAIVREGQAGFARAIELARALLDDGARQVAVGGVDSYYHPQVLAWLDEQGRLHGLDVEDGFIPSEAAAFLLLSREKGAAQRLGFIADVATAQEATAEGEQEPNLADAMTELLSEVGERAGVPFRWAITDLNGERHRQAEWTKSSTRALPLDAVHTKWVWATGEVGAAAGPLYSVTALRLFELGAAPDSRAVLALHSEGPQRGVVSLMGVRRD